VWLSRSGFFEWLLRFFVLVLVLVLLLVLEGVRSVQRASVNAAAECDGCVWGLSQRHRATEARRGMCRTVVCPVAAGAPLRSSGFPARARCCVLLTICEADFQGGWPRHHPWPPTPLSRFGGEGRLSGQSGEPWAAAHGCECWWFSAASLPRTRVLPYPARLEELAGCSFCWVKPVVSCQFSVRSGEGERARIAVRECE
jgi:hypothetical protein